MAAWIALFVVLGGTLVGCGGGRIEGSPARAAPLERSQRLSRRLHHLQRELADRRRQAGSEARLPRAETTASRQSRPRQLAAAARPAAAGGAEHPPFPAARSTAPPRGAVVAIDPGHNGGNGAHPEIINRPVVAYADGRTKACDTTGTETNDGRLTEALFNLQVAKALSARLQARGFGVVMTRTTNRGVGPCINRRAVIGNRADASAAISIHADGNEAAGAHGFDVIYPARDELVHPRIARPSKRLALVLRDALAKAGIPPANYVGSDGLDARDDLGGLNLSSVPKVLVELGNMRSSSEAARLESRAYRARLVGALVAGIERFLRGR